jgi:DNA segregation ATPase FtsK/SpoIIIE-like protein
MSNIASPQRQLWEDNDDLYVLAAQFVKTQKHPSVVGLMKKFTIGYGRAMNLVNELVRLGAWPMSSESNGTRKRKLS